MKFLTTSSMVIAMSAVVFSVSAASAAGHQGMMGPTVMEDSMLKACDRHDKAGKDCHIHNRDTFLHMSAHVPGEGQPHAWAEYRKWQKWSENRKR